MPGYFSSLIGPLLVCFIAMPSLTLAGMATLRLLKYRWTPLLQFCVAAALGILEHGCLGLLMAGASRHKHELALTILPLTFLASAFVLLRKNGIAYVKETYGRESIFAFSAWVLMSVIALAVGLLPVKLPGNLPDGAYIFKNDRINIRIQKLSGDLPADNLIPFIVSEFLLRNISFKTQHPILPGQEIACRPILMSLVTAPYLAASSEVKIRHKPLPTFSYVGKTWPDTGRLADDTRFALFLGAAIPLNAAIILPMLLFAQRFNAWRWRWWIVALFITSPYLLVETLFTWPKMMAGFFLLTAGYALFIERRLWLAGLLCALAYWSHPFASLFVASISAWAAWEAWKGRFQRRECFVAGATLAVLLAPWFIWTRLLLRSVDDLFLQNFLSDSFLSAILIRFYNVWATVIPTVFGEWPMSFEKLFRESVIRFPCAVGWIFTPYIPIALRDLGADHRALRNFFIILPGLLVIGVFGNPAVPAVHGFQTFAPLFIVLCVSAASAQPNRVFFYGIMAVQLLFNVILLTGRIVYLTS